jgi:hypothetical protein
MGPTTLRLGAFAGNIPNPEMKLLAQSAQRIALSFRPWGEILLGSLAFSRDDGFGPSLSAFAPLRDNLRNPNLLTPDYLLLTEVQR